MRREGTHPFHDTCPRYRVMFIGEYTQMCQQQLDTWCIEEVTTRHLKVGQPCFRHSFTDTISIRIGTDDDGCTLLLILLIKGECLSGNILVFSFYRTTMYDSQVTQRSLSVIVGKRE